MKKKSKAHLFTVLGVEVNLSSVLTTVVGFVSVSLISAGLSWLHEVKTAIKALPEIKAEQDRIKKEYAPPLQKK